MAYNRTIDGKTISYTLGDWAMPPAIDCRIHANPTAVWVMVGDDWYRWDGGATFRLNQPIADAHLATAEDWVKNNGNSLQKFDVK